MWTNAERNPASSAVVRVKAIGLVVFTRVSVVSSLFELRNMPAALRHISERYFLGRRMLGILNQRSSDDICNRMGRNLRPCGPFHFFLFLSDAFVFLSLSILFFCTMRDDVDIRSYIREDKGAWLIIILMKSRKKWMRISLYSPCL